MFVCEIPSKKEDQTSLFQLKLMLPESNKVLLFFKSREDQMTAKYAILRMQGFESHFASYEVKKLIGEGSCNPVWLAEHRIAGCKVAIKEINNDKYTYYSENNGISEGKALYLFKESPYMITLIDEFTEGDKTYIVTKYYKGGDLFEFIQGMGKREFSEDKARHIFRQLAQGVQFLH